MTNHRRVAVLGGSFNPIHVGHMIMAENALVDLDLDEVIFAPAGDPPHKDTRGLLAADDRLAMVKLATENRPGFRVSTMDMESSGPSFTWRLLERMLERESATQFWFLMGGDSVRDFPTWRRPERILELARLAVVERPGFLLDLGGSRQVPELPYRADVIEAPLCDVSSTDIRNRITSGRSIRYLVPESVRSYIEERSLFHDTPTGEGTGGRPAS
jgi:nicotinate-nucleotide adenylyltransferase